MKITKAKNQTLLYGSTEGQMYDSGKSELLNFVTKNRDKKNKYSVITYEFMFKVGQKDY